MPTDPAKDVFDLRVNIDTGGTFTDCYVAGPPGGITAKVDTTPYDLSVGVVESIRLAASKWGSRSKRFSATQPAFGYPQQPARTRCSTGVAQE